VKFNFASQFVEPRLKQKEQAHAVDVRQIQVNYEKEMSKLKAETVELRVRLDARINEHHLSKTHELEIKRLKRIITDMQNKVCLFCILRLHCK